MLKPSIADCFDMDWTMYMEDEYTEGVEFPIAQFNPSIAITRLVSFAEQSPSGYDTKVRMDEECRVK